MARFDFGTLEAKNRKRLSKDFRKEKRIGRFLTALIYLMVLGALILAVLPIKGFVLKIIAIVFLIACLVLSGVYNHFFSEWLLTKEEDYIHLK